MTTRTADIGSHDCDDFKFAGRLGLVFCSSPDRWGSARRSQPLDSPFCLPSGVACVHTHAAVHTSRGLYT